MRLFRLALLLLPLVLTGCTPSADDSGLARLSIAATAVPHAEILKLIQPELEKDGLRLEIRIFNDYVQPNDQVVQGQIDLNYFQTQPYLEAYNRDHGARLVLLAGVHIEPFGAYSRRFTDISALPEGADVALPNDPSNLARALRLLHHNGLIELADADNALASRRDIRSNPRNLSLRELDAAMLPRVLDQVDLALINTNYALDAGLDPTRDALLIESKDSPYVNYLVGLPDKQNDPRVQTLIARLHSDAVRQFILERYKNAVIPAF